MWRSAAKDNLRPQRKGYFGAQSHTPRNRCVRFVFGITAASRNTSFQAACWALPGPDLHRPIAPASLSPALCPPYDALYRSVGEPRQSVRCDTSAAANVCCVLLAVNRCRANNLRTLCIMKEPIRESKTMTNGTYAVQKIASMNHELLFVSTRLGGADMFVRQGIPTLPRQRRVLSFGRENCQNWNALLAPLDVVFTVVGFRIEIGGAPADRAQVGIALGQGEVHAAQQRQCNCNHGHDLLHGSLLLFDAACRPHRLKRLKR